MGKGVKVTWSSISKNNGETLVSQALIQNLKRTIFTNLIIYHLYNNFPHLVGRPLWFKCMPV